MIKTVGDLIKALQEYSLDSEVELDSGPVKELRILDYRHWFFTPVPFHPDRLYILSDHDDDDPSDNALRDKRVEVVVKAVEVWTDKKAALDFLWRENATLEDKAPMHIMHSVEGCEKVIQLLGRIQNGICV